MGGSKAHIPAEVPTLAETLRDVGYSTAMVGKWHLGYASWDYTPVGRGFDSFAGYLQGQVDYVTKEFGVPGTKFGNGLDFWRNRTEARDAVGNYSMDFYMAEAERVLDQRDPNKPFFLYFAHQEIHIPLEAPVEQEYADACQGVTATENRNTLCRMTNRLDKSIGDFTDMLKSRNLWEDTLLWVTTDNGGMTAFQDAFPASASSNFPLRGGKATLFEGGVRGVSFLNGGFLPSSASGRVVDGLLQHVDIPVTLAALANASIPSADGFDVWDVVVDGMASPRSEVPVNVDPRDCGQANGTAFNALISGSWKLIEGLEGMYDGWWHNGDYTHELINETSANVTVDGVKVFLFDLAQDPNERENVALSNPDVVSTMRARLAQLGDASAGFVAPQTNTPSPRALPQFHNGVWAPFLKSSVGESELV